MTKLANSVIEMALFAHALISIKNFGMYTCMYILITNKTLSNKFHPYSILSK